MSYNYPHKPIRRKRPLPPIRVGIPTREEIEERWSPPRTFHKPAPRPEPIAWWYVPLAFTVLVWVGIVYVFVDSIL